MFGFWSVAAQRGVVLLLLSVPCLAADWTYVDSSTERASLEPRSVFADNDGILVQGPQVGNPYSWVIARYDNALNLQWARTNWFNTRPAVAALPDGGFIALAYGAIRLDRDGGTVWEHGFSNTPTLIGIDASSGMWLRGADALARVAADGTFVEFPWQVQPGAGTVDPATATLFVVRPAALTSVFVPLAILRYDRQGAQTLLWQTSDLLLSLQFVALDEHKNIFAEGTDATGLYALSLSPDGSIRWERHYPNGAQPPIAYAPFADGTMVTLDQTGKLYRIATDGNLSFTLPLGAGSACVAPCSARIRTTANGDAIVLISGAQSQLIRVDAAGHVVSSQTWTGSTSTDFGVLADGSVLVAASPMLHVDRAGNALPLPPVDDIVDVGTILLTHAGNPDGVQSADGALYFFSQSTASRKAWLSKLSVSGTLLWKQPVDPDSASNLTLGSDLACWGAIECHATDSGELAFVNTTHRLVAQLVFLEDGSILAHTYSFGSNDALLALDKSGGVIRNVGLGREFRGSSSALSSTGILVASVTGPGGDASAWDRDGNLLYSTTAPPNDYYTVLGVDGDGNALLNSLTYLRALSSTGATRWTLAVPAYPGYGLDRITNGDAYLWSLDGSVYPPAPSHLERRSMRDGKARP